MDINERTNYYIQPSRWINRYQLTPDFYPERVCGGADLIYNDSWRRCIISKAEITRLASRPRRSIPDIYPTG